MTIPDGGGVVAKEGRVIAGATDTAATTITPWRRLSVTTRDETTRTTPTKMVWILSRGSGAEAIATASGTAIEACAGIATGSAGAANPVAVLTVGARKEALAVPLQWRAFELGRILWSVASDAVLRSGVCPF